MNLDPEALAKAAEEAESIHERWGSWEDVAEAAITTYLEAINREVTQL